jgi:hypothetical protein
VANIEKVSGIESNVDVVISQLKGASRVRVAKEGIVSFWPLNATLASIFFLYYLGGLLNFFRTIFSTTMPTDAGIEPRTVATGALAVRRSNH